MSEGRWGALYTKVNQENVAITHLKRQAFETYCPMILRTRKHARKVEKVKRPVFPSYVFVRLDYKQTQWRSILSTRGVQSLVKFGDRVGFLSESFIDEMRHYESEGTLQQMVAPPVKPGDKVTLTEGPFQNFIANVLSLPEKDRIWVLLDMMGQKVRVSQNISALIPA